MRRASLPPARCSRRWVTHRGSTLLALFALSLISGVPALAHTSDDVTDALADRNRALQRVRSLEEDLTAAIISYDEAHTALDDAEARVERTQAGVDEYERRSRSLRERARAAAIESYVSGGLGELAVPLATQRIQDLVMAMYLSEKIRERQVADLNQLSTVTRQTTRLKQRLEGERESAAMLESEAAAASEEITRLLSAAEHELDHAEQKYAGIKAEYEEEQRRRREAELARIRASTDAAERGLPATATDGFTCPVQGGASFIDSWGFARSGGRRHKGVDMFATRGTPTAAVTSGTVRMRTVNLGGIVTYLYGDDGNKYYYAHLNGYPDGLQNGQRVNRGDAIGFVGNTGNAEGTSPHLHFEIRPGGGNAVNPYPTVRSACP